MKLLILGHSYVRDLSKLGVSYITHERNVIDVKYVAYPGASYDLFLRDPSKLTAALSYNPDIVVVVLAGNAIHRDISNYELFNKCKSFYQLLREELPNAIIISAQTELRFYNTVNAFGAPKADEYRKKRDKLNKFLNALKLKDHMLLIAGPGRLDNRRYYKDEVHLNKVGIRLYMTLLHAAVVFVLDKRMMQ